MAIKNERILKLFRKRGLFMRVSKLVMDSMTSQGCFHDNVWPVESGCNSLATKIVAKVSRSLVLPKKVRFRRYLNGVKNLEQTHT
jgi:hypothetical protein